MFIIVLILCTLTVRGNEPECGIVTLHGSQALIIGGKSAQRGEVPWHAGIYRKTSKPYQQICGGSLISNNIIISAAHCFWDEIEKQLPAERYAAAVGKIYRPWEPNVTKEEDQKADVKEIHLPVRYQGSEANNQEDIAIVIVNTPFQYSRYVRPICIDFDLIFDRKQLQSGKYGKVAGWGLVSEDGESSHILKLIELPYVDTKTCILESPFTYRPHITGDKFCAGYKASNVAICKGDSGGGLAFPFTDKGITRYYLRGVVSSAPVSDHKCNANTFTSFTQVQKHEYFIKQFWGPTSIDVSADACSPLPLSLTQRKTGQKAWDKCIEYQEKLVFPCSESATGSINRANRCHHNAGKVFTDSEIANQNEFPHMALIGYGDDVNLKWLCGGTLISEKFVLTAGQCRSAAIETGSGQPTYIVMNILNRRDAITKNNRIKIERIHKHPEYRPPNKYNDIALLELTKEVFLNEFIVPACLDTGKEIIDNRAYATGWGSELESNDLKKVATTKFNTEKCAEMYSITRILRNGIDLNTQICYLMAPNRSDICFSNGGGPLQVLNKDIACMYTIIGVASFSKGCGSDGEPGVYTKVAHYLEWIEKIVWP